MSFSLPNSQIPTEGPVGIPLVLDFTGGDNVTGDFALEQTSGTINFVQSAWIDNSKNTKALTLTISGTGQIITLKAGMVAMLPIIAANGSFSWRAQSVGAAVQVPVIFMNVDRPSIVYQAV